MKRHTWIITGTGCLLAAALLGSLPGIVTGDDREDEGQRSTREAGQAPAANEQKASDRDRPDGSRNDGREEQNGRAVLGVFVGPSPTTGARIQRVEPQGAAAQAGLRPGDFILSINGSKIGKPEDVQQAVAGLEPGGEAKITLWRNGQTQELTVMLGERRAAGFRGTDSGAAREFRGSRDGGVSGWLGMALAETADGDGVRIQSVAPGGPAARAELRAGDVIKGIDSDEVSRVADMMKSLQQHKAGADVWLSIVRDDEEHAVRVTMAGRSQFPGSTGTSEFRGFRGDFAGEAPDQARMNRFFEEHQRLTDRLEKLEAEVQALKSKLGAGAPEQNRRQERQPQREE